MVTTPIARWARPGGGVVVPPRAPRLFPHFFNRVTYMTVAPAWLWLPSPHPPPLSSRSLLLSCVPRGRVALHHHHPTSQPTRLRVAAAAATVGPQSPRERVRARARTLPGAADRAAAEAIGDRRAPKGRRSPVGAAAAAAADRAATPPVLVPFAAPFRGPSLEARGGAGSIAADETWCVPGLGIRCFCLFVLLLRC